MIGQRVHSHRYRKIVQIVQELIETPEFLERDTNVQFCSIQHSVQILVVSVNLFVKFIVRNFQINEKNTATNRKDLAIIKICLICNTIIELTRQVRGTCIATKFWQSPIR